MTVVCITGMHRSGTSLVARIANLLGLRLGPAEHLMAPKPENPKGFWENEPIAMFNERLLRHLGGSWDDPPVLPDGWQDDPSLDDRRDEAGGILAEVFGDTGRLASDDRLVGWKDPRMVFVLPFWRTVVPIDHTVVVARDPAAVVASLASRSGSSNSVGPGSPEASADLWLRYTLGALRLEGDRTWLFYEDLFEDLDRDVGRLAEALGTGDPDDETWREIVAFRDPELRRSDDVEVETSGLRMRLARGVWQLLRGDQPADPDVVLSELVVAVRASAVEPELERLHTRALAAEADALESRRSTERLHRQLGEAIARGDRLADEKEEQRTRLRDERDRAREDHRREQERARILEEVASAARRDAARLRARADELETTLAEAEARLADRRPVPAERGRD